MVTLVRTNSEHLDFVRLVKLLDADLAIRDGAEEQSTHFTHSSIGLIRSTTSY
jgi:hypothetical protein